MATASPATLIRTVASRTAGGEAPAARDVVRTR
jgi:hypothetical protein